MEQVGNVRGGPGGTPEQDASAVAQSSVAQAAQDSQASREEPKAETQEYECMFHDFTP